MLLTTEPQAVKATKKTEQDLFSFYFSCDIYKLITNDDETA